MKAYICDSCGKAMHGAHELKLKHRTPDKTYKEKIHLCTDCFHALNEIAAKNDVSSYYAFESREIERIRKEGTAMCGNVKMDESQQIAFGLLDELDHLVTDCSNLRNLADKAKWHPEHLDHYHELICIIRRELAKAIQNREVVTITPEVVDMKEVEK